MDFFRVTPKRRSVKLKKRKGVLFSNPSFFKKIIFHFGTFLFLVSLTYGLYLYWPLLNAIGAYVAYANNEVSPSPTTTLVPTIVEPSPTLLPQQPSPTPSPVKEEYSIDIPKIQAKSAIVPNVDPFDRREYLEVLKEDVVAQSKTSNFVGGGNGSMTYIFAHSTQQGISMVRKNAVFYLIGQLKNGDEIIINHDQQLYKYLVYDQKIINASDVQYLKYRDNDKEVLILQTCWPIGTDWKRLLVFAKRE